MIFMAQYEYEKVREGARRNRFERHYSLRLAFERLAERSIRLS